MKNEFEQQGQDRPPFDWDDAGKMLGATAQQVKFAMAKARGANNTQAARSAGYAGNDVQLRQVGYRAFRSEKVQALLKWAEAEGAGVPDTPCDGAELKRILSRHARGADKSASIRASEVLHRLEMHEAEIRQDPVSDDPIKNLEQMAEVDPGFAVKLAEARKIDWKPKGWDGAHFCPTCHQPATPVRTDHGSRFPPGT